MYKDSYITMKDSLRVFFFREKKIPVIQSNEYQGKYQRNIGNNIRNALFKFMGMDIRINNRVAV